MSLDKAGTLRYNLKYKQRLSAKSGRSSDRFYVEKKAAFLFRGSGYFFMYPKIPIFTVCTLMIACASYCVNQPSFQAVFIFAVRDGLMYPSFFCHKMQKTAQKGGLLTDSDCICYNRNGQVHIAVRPSVPFPLSAAGRRWRECGKRHFSFSYVQ